MMKRMLGAPIFGWVGLVMSVALSLALIRPAWSWCGDEILEPGEDCDDGGINGQTFGGDGCAANCTFETLREFPLDPTRSRATTQFPSLLIELNLSGYIRFVTGKPDTDGVIPFAVRSQDVYFGRIQVPGVACACLRSIDSPELFGPGNAGRGLMGCGGGFLFSSVAVKRDHNIGVVDHCLEGPNDGQACISDTECPDGQCFSVDDCTEAEGTVEPPTGLHPGVCNGPRVVEILAPNGPRGTVGLYTNIGFNLLFDGGSCCDVGIDPGCVDPTGEKGPDGIACSEDDPGSTQGIDAPGFTGPSQVSLTDLNNVPGATLGPSSDCGGTPCVTEVEGELFDCDAILANPTGNIETGVLGLAFQILDYVGFGDALITVTLAALPGETACAGDCNGNGTVTVDELIRGVNIALGAALIDTCVAFDRDKSGSVTIDELITAVGKALNGCA